jgi:mannose-6-phosphate isomerase-like protein (cupin superfamily)
MTTATTSAARSVWFLGNLATIHLSGEETNNRFSLVEMLTPHGEQPPLHVHREDDEGFYVIDGEVTLWYGDRRLDLTSGDFALAPHGIPHTYRVESEAGARMLVTSSTADFDRFVADVGEPAAEMRLPDRAAPDIDRLAAIAAEHGIDILGPPGTLPDGAAQ